MEKNIKNKKDKLNFLLKISFCFALLLIVFLVLPQYSNESFAATEETNSEYCYLSDMDWTTGSRPGWGELLKDTTSAGSKISVKVEGAYYTFDKGIWAHAASTVIYDLTTTPNGEKYDYFTAYLGLNQTAGTQTNGVIYKIYTSTDGTNWTIKYNEEGNVSKRGDNADFVKIPIKDEKFLKLEAGSNGGNGGDHSVYADAKLIKENYKEPGEELIPDITELDTKIKEFIDLNADLSTNKEYELTLLKRELISRMGNYALKRFLGESEENRLTYKWLTEDVDLLRLYVMGGNPAGGNYCDSLSILAKLYVEYSSDFENTELLGNPTYPEMTYGDLYTKMAMAISLTHSQRVGLWMQSSKVENQSEPLRRYAIYKYLHKNGGMRISAAMDMTHVFEDLHVTEMRLVVFNNIDDEEILWLNRYTQDNIDANPNNVWRYQTPHPYIAYIWPNYQRAEYYDPNNESYFNELFAVKKTDDNKGKELVNADGEETGKIGIFDSEFVIPGGKNIPEYRLKVTRSAKENITTGEMIYKVWMNFRNKFGTGCVCGGISKSGANIRGVHGIPAMVIGQPGHAALMFYSKDGEGRGYWRIDNDVSGWTLSGGGGALLGWGSGSHTQGFSAGVYIELEQAAVNDYQNLIKAEEQVMLAKVYAGDLEKQEELYGKALEIQSINFDAWLGLINVYKANVSKTQGDGGKTEEDFYALAEDIAENLKYYPLPMYNATNLIKPYLTSTGNAYKFVLLQTRTLKLASTLPNNTATSFTVMQPGVTRLEANYLLGQMDTTIATFSFDGPDAGKILLASRFDGNGVRFDYSLDGKQTWKEVDFSAEEEHKLQLTPEEIASITAENDIYVHIVGVSYDEKNLYKIDILDNVISENTLYGNDLENRVIGVNLTYEWRNSENDPWTSYATSSPDNTGNKTLQVRQAATGVKLASNVLTFTFTEDNQPDTRKYIPVSHLSIHAVSTQATANGGAAVNAIDANYNTRYHSAWNGSDTERYIVIKLDKSVVLSAVEFVPAGGGNGRIVDGTVYGSMDGETWEELSKLTNQTYSAQANTNEQAKAFTKNFEIADENRKEVQYVKIVADRTNGNWFTARAFNLYQDLTKNPHPTAGVAYSTTEPTNGVVVARLINPSTEITITNNDGKDTYVFTENGEFTFEFVDKNGNTGSAIAKVDWIDKDGPTVDVNYGLDADKKLTILLDNISKDVYLLDEDNNKINYIEVNEVSKKITNITYLDNEGNSYKVLDKDTSGNTTKITYKNTTGNVSTVATYITTLDNGAVASEEYFDSEGNAITNLTDAEKETLRTLQQTARSNPLEQALETSGEYEFKLVDKSGNILCKNIKVDYIENTIIASDITYNITKLTNTDVVATINPYIIDTEGKHASVEVTSEGGATHTFTENGEFTFEYKDSSDTENWNVKQHKAKVDWIDKTAPTAEVRYSTTESTDKPVVATLVNESEDITITNNGTSREYTFTENDEFTFRFIDKAGNVGTVTAKVDWIVEDTTVTSEKYKVSAGYVSRIPVDTTVSEFKSNVTSNEELTILDKDGNVLQDEDKLTTGVILKAGEEKQYTLVLIGDINEDGKITITDLVQLKLFTVNLRTPNVVQKMAADMNGDGRISITDLVKLNLMLVHIEE